MSDPVSTTAPEAGREDLQTALFADLVLRQSNLVLICLGQSPRPQDGQRSVDLEAAQMFIDQLEMLEAKTRGNLSQPEEHLLRQTLTHLRMLFVQVSEHPPQAASSASPGAASPAPAQPGDSPGQPEPAANPPASPPADESKVKFSKKY